MTDPRLWNAPIIRHHPIGMGQAPPPGQPPQAGSEEQESQDGDSEARPTAKPERSLPISAPHFSQAGASALRLLCRTSTT